MRNLQPQLLARLLRSRVYALLILVLMCASCSPSAPTALPLTKTFDKSPTGFEFKYPDEWEYTIPMQGILMSAPPETLNGEYPGPIFVVQRGLPVSIPGDISAALNSFLQAGPLQNPDQWRVITPEAETTLDNRPARVVEIEGSDDESGETVYSRIIATTSDNTFVYMVILTVPVNLRARYEPTLDAMLASVRILE